MNYIHEHVPSVDSTNEELKRRFTRGDKKELLLSADFQSAGKGRNGRSFYSPQDTGIYFSYLYPNPEKKPVSDLIFVTTVAAVLVCDAIIRIIGPDDVGIKWVNDVYVKGKKVCGILAEAVFNGDTPGIVVGIGINLTTTDFPGEIKDIASGIGRFDNEELSRIKQSILHDVGEGLHRFFENMDEAAYRKEILALYKKESLVIGKEVVFTESDIGERTARAFDIGEDGSLAVELPSGEKISLHSGEIHLKLKEQE